MIRGRTTPPRLMLTWCGCAILIASFAIRSQAQTSPVERTLPASKSAVERALKQLQSGVGGHLPTLDGFAQPGEYPLNRYQRPFYQCNVRVTATPTGESVVQVSAKITAWYADSTSPAHSGYKLLTSNGRLENDLLDQLADQLSAGSKSAENRLPVVRPAPAPKQPAPADSPGISAPLPGSGANSEFSKTAGSRLSASGAAVPPSSAEAKPSAKETDVRAETESLKEVLDNQARPRNIVAIKKSGTPVVGSPSINAKPLFLASEHDEFEMLDFNNDWVHVRISGLSRGWIWRTSLEMPEGIPDIPQTSAASPTAADLFQVSREETAPFPGDWTPLRGKTVKIISVQKVQENERDSGAQAKLEFAKSILDKGYGDLAKSPDLSGIVLIFDSSDGGMIAVTLSTIQRWKAGTLTDAAMWHQCYFDPPETFSISSAAASTGR